MNTTVLPSFADSGWSSTGAGNRANFLGPDPDAPDLQMYSGSHYAAWRDLSALVPGHFYDMVFVVKPCGKEADGSLVPMALRFGTMIPGDGGGQWNSFPPNPPAVITGRQQVSMRFMKGNGDVAVFIRDDNGRPWSASEVAFLDTTASAPAPGPAPAPTPGPAPAPAPSPAPSPPAPAPPVITSDKDLRELRQMLNDGVCILEDRVYTLSDRLDDINQHGAMMVGKNRRLPPRANTPRSIQWGPRIVYDGPETPIVINPKRTPGNHFLTGIKMGFFRIEAGRAKHCMDIQQACTSLFESIAAIGPNEQDSPGAVVIITRGGIQSELRDIDACGMGYPEVAGGAFQARATAGIRCEPGKNEDGGNSPYTAFVLNKCYAHQCKVGIQNWAGLMTIGDQTVFEDNLIGLELSDTARTFVTSGYWEANRNSLIKMGKASHLFLANVELGNTTNAPVFVQCDPAGFYAFSIENSYVKGPGRLFTAGVTPAGPGGFAVSKGTSLPLGMDIGPLVELGPTGIGSGR